jgi:hypothetical protein
MNHAKLLVSAVLGVTSVLLVPARATAQLGSSGIAGVVRDATGAILPGVTVEAASPALIERVRTVVTDAAGQYKIVSLSPGRYTVTFSLPGFATVRREDVDLAANFTAPINAELRVGAIEETVTVSGQSPVVDTQNTSVRNLIPTEVLDAIPTNKTLGAWAALTPGMVVAGTAMDVGGSKGEQSLRLAIHGGHGGEQRVLVDGMNTSGGGSDWGYVPNPASAQEVSLELGAGTAEAMLGGVLINFVPKDGGNKFSGFLSGNFANASMQGSNLSDEVKARGLTELSVNKVHDIWDYNGTLGGPVFPDKLWFFTAHRRWGNSTQVAGIFHNATQDGWVFTPDYNRPGYADYLQRSQSIRLTWQASARNKIRLFFDYQNHCDCHRGLDTGSAGNGTPTAPEAAHYRKYFPNNVPQASWSFPANSKLLIEAGVSARLFNWRNMPEPGVTPDTISITESSNNFLYHAAPNYGEHLSTQANQRFAVSYVTGSHAFKTGVFVLQEWRRQTDDPNLGVTYQFRNGRPTQLTQFVVPTKEWDRISPDLGLFAQDQWTMNRLTLNLGLRFDYLRGYVPAQHLPAGPFVPARDYDAINCVPCWKDLSPRLSAAYDLFGHSKTAVKVSVGRYVGQQSAVGLPSLNNPVQTTVKSATRSWTDPNGDFIPQESELGPVSNSNFGKNTVATQYSSDVLLGFGTRDYNWQTGVSLQQELVPGVAATLAYFHTAWSNFRVTDNVLVGPTDYDPYCIQLPADSRLPGGGGNQLCGLYNITPTKFNAVSNLVVPDSNFGKQTEIYNGVDFTVSARLPRRASLGGGISAGRTATSNCAIVDSPQQALFCSVTPPFQPRVKLNGVYPLPWDMQVSGVFQSNPGTPISASYVATNAQVQPSLNRPLSGSASTVTITNIFQPQTEFEGRINQLDARLTKNITVGRSRIQAQFDLYNVFNASPILGINTRYGQAWLTPTEILGARLFKIGAQFSF